MTSGFLWFETLPPHHHTPQCVLVADPNSFNPTRLPRETANLHLVLTQTLCWGEDCIHRQLIDTCYSPRPWCLLQWGGAPYLSWKGNKKEEIPRDPGEQDNRLSHPKGDLRPSGALRILFILPEPELIQSPTLQKKPREQEEKMSNRKHMTLPEEKPLLSAIIRRQMISKLLQATHLKATKTASSLKPRNHP